MAVIGRDTKQPNEILDWDVDWADWMRPADTVDIVETSVRVLSGGDTIPLVVDKVESTATLSKVWLSGGTNGCRYRVQVRITTTEGRVKEAEFDITVKEI